MYRFGLTLGSLVLLPLLLAGSVQAGGPSGDAKRLQVVATFSILGDFVKAVGGDRVVVRLLVGPGGDAHVFQPTPSDAAALRDADVVVENGLGFEGWLARLIETSGYVGPRLVASKGAALLQASPDNHHHGHKGHGHSDHGHGDQQAKVKDVDPHAWHSLGNAAVYVANIRDGLCAADPGGCRAFEANAKAYAEKLHALDEALKARFSAIPDSRRKVITSHQSFAYFARDYRVKMDSPVGTSTEEQASAKDIARLIRQIRSSGTQALFIENISNPRLVEQIARETGVKPSGRLFSDALSGADGPAPTYYEMMRFNATAIADALEASS